MVAQASIPGTSADALDTMSQPFFEEMQKRSESGLQKPVIETGTKSKVLNIAGDLLHMAPAIIGAETTGGATFYLQGVGGAAQQVDEMKKAGVKFDNGSDELFIQGSGFINYLLGKSVASTVMSKMGSGFANDIVGSLSAEATRDLANLGAKATAEDVAKVYTGRALNFIERFKQFGMGMLKTYPKIGTEFAGANLLGSGLKAGVNAMNGDRKPFGEVTGDEIVKDISSPFYNNDTPAGGDLGQFVQNIINTPAVGLSALHGAMTMGMLFDKSPYKNAVIESLQKDGSPENVAAVKEQITQQGLRNGWTDDEIANTHTGVDALADITSKIPADIRPYKFNDATNLILGRRQLEAVLKETQLRKEGLDPAIAGKAAPFEALLTAKIEQANDKLDELITDKSYTYSEENGKYFKTKLGEDPIEISKDRFDLEVIENKAKPKAEKSKVLVEPAKETSADKPAEPAPKDPAPAKVDNAMLDDLDAELESFKQPSEKENVTDIQKSVTQVGESGNKKPESVTKAAEPETKPAKVETNAEKLDEVVKANPERIIKATIPKNEPTTENKPAPAAPVEKPAPAATEPKESPVAPANEKPADIEKRNSFVSDKLTEDDYRQIQPGTEGQTVHSITNYGSSVSLIYAKKPNGEDVAIVKQFDSQGDPVEHKYSGWKEPAVAKKRYEELTSELGGVYTGPAAKAKALGKYYTAIKNEEGITNFEETDGKPLTNDHGLDLFSHDRGDDFAVTEGSTGLKIADGATEEEAIANANKLLSTKTPAEMQAIIKAKHESGLKSPRGIVEQKSADTENTEAVITKAAATVRKAKAVKGKPAEPAGIIADIDESLAEIDREIESIGGDPNQEPPVEPEPEPTEPPPADKKKTKREEFEQELKDAKAAFMKTFNKALSGINPETIEKGIKLIAVYAKIGMHDFKEIARDLAADLGAELRDIFEGLKASYGAFASQEATEAQLDLMTDIREVRRATIEEFIPKKENNDTGSKLNAVDENTSAVDAGKPAAGTTDAVQQQPAKGLSGQKDDGSGTAGNEPKGKPAKADPNGSGQSGSGSDIGTGEPGTTGRPAERDNGSAVPENTKKRVVAPADQNHIIKPTDVIVPTGAVGKFNANVDALFLLKKLESENRNPSPAEKQQLAQFVGWGGLAKYLDTPNRADNEAIAAYINGKRAAFYDNRYNRVTMDFTDRGPMDINKYESFNDLLEDARKSLVNSGYSISPDSLRAPLLKAILSNEEYSAAQNSTINAHYTDRAIIKNMWDITNKLGFKGGRVLESSAGIGHFFGLMPESLRGKTSLQAYELDSITGRIMQKLYPQSSTTVTGFENSRVPQNSVDLAIGNVPFAASAPYDKSFPELSKFSMHNYFIAKNLKLLKPGGLAVMITSASTMDSASSARFREWVTSPEGGNSYLVGAIRLPSNAFAENAGTQVTTDMLVFQKKGQVVNADLEQPFRYTKMLKTGKDDRGNDVDLHVNEYFIDNPKQMLGEMMTAHEAGSGGLYGGDTATLKAPEGMEFTKELTKATEAFPSDISGNKTEPEQIKAEPITAIDKKEGSVFEKGGKIYKVSDGEGQPMELSVKEKEVAKAYTGLKSGMLSLIEQEQAETPTGNLEQMRAELNKQYDAFVKKHGFINSRTTDFLNDADIDFPIVASLENIARSIEKVGTRDKIVQNITKGEILTKRINYPRVEPVAADNIKDAINISLNYRTGLDINYMAKMLGEEPEALRQRLLDDELAYLNPDTGILETSEEYLSGYVRDKLKKAEIAAVNDPAYLKNIDQLKKIIPEDIPSSLISYSLGSSWIPNHVYEQFASKVMDAKIGVKYLDRAGKYLISKGYGWNSAQVQNTYSAGGMNGIDILDDTLNNKQIIVNDTVIAPDGTKKTVKNPEKTAAAQAMQQQMQEEFESFVRGDETVQQETERIYNDVFNGQVLRNYRIPEFKHYPGASSTITLRQHQKRAVSRGLSESTLFAHEVGSGKTFTIITTAMEMRRLGTARKPLIGVQNSTLGDFVADFKKLYPSAKILAPSEKEMEAEGRKRLFAKIATGDWDAIILPHSQITMIPDDPERQKAYIMEQIQEMRDTIATIDDARERRKMEFEVKKLTQEMDALTPDEEGVKKGGKAMAKKIGEKSLKIEADMQKALDRKTDNIFNFEQLGIDAMLMDEAHKYKRLGFQTSMKNIKGIDTSKSQRSQSILLKSRWIQEKTGGKNVNFYTGTPISNTMAEAWTMIKYLRPDILEHLGIQYFDQFAKTFGQVVPSLEQTGGGTFKVQNRFAKFQNLPEFITAFRATTDVVLTDDVKEFQNTDTIPKLKNGKFTQVIIQQSPELKAQIGEFKRTLEWFDKLSGREKKENSHVPLVVFNKAKQASIDLRLLDPTNVDSTQSKVNQAIQNAFDIYKETKGKKGVQMIFSDMYQSPEPKNQYLDEDGFVVNPAYGKDRFNLFEDIKKKLVKMGVPADEIVIFTEPKYDKAERKKAVFADANSGKIRFLLGTTEKMGVGVNAQKKLVALHHLDAPARPMDFEQRNGRIIRQGNENKEVDVLTYGVEKTLDSSAFQRLSTKQKFINQVMKGENIDRVTEDPADEAQMTFDEMMAQLSDSPFAMQKLLVDNKLRSEVMKQANFSQKIIRSNKILRETENALRKDKALLSDQINQADVVRTKFVDGNITSIQIKDEPEITEKFGEGADKYIQRLIDKYYASPTKFAKGGFTVNGVRVELQVVNKEEISKATNLVVDTPLLEYTMPEIGLNGESWTSSGFQIPSNSGAGLLSSLRSKLNDVLVKPSRTQGTINQAEKDIEQLKKDAQAKFDDSKLKSLTEESEALKVKMLADKPTPPDDTPGGGQTVAEYIKDQSNIKPALDFLDTMKAKNDGRFMSTIVPIPPAVWNGAIDVMKSILKATNSTQKAIRVAGKYIIDRGGTDAQAKDFEATMAEKMANTNVGKKATVADTDETHTEEVMVKAATEIRSKIKSEDLSPDEKEFAGVDLKVLTKKELHRYIEVAAVMAVDPQGVLTKDVTDLLDRVENRLNPKSGTAVPPAPPTVPPGEDGLMDGEGDGERKRIPKKDKLPMESTESLPEQTDDDGKPVGKDNYSAIGRFKDIRVRNLEQLKQYGTDIGDLSALRDVRQYATSKSQASIVMKTATDRIIKAVGKEGWNVLRQALVESRLRGTKQRFENWATQIKKSSDNDIDDLFEDGKTSLMYDVISRLDGYEGDPKPEQTILALVSNGEYDDAREYMSDIFENAADNVAFYDKLANGKTFDEMIVDGAFVDPKMQEAFNAYKSLLAKPFEESHAANEGVFSDALGPLESYYPLVPVGKDKHFVVRPGNKYRAPENPNNKFATGQGNQYSSALSDLTFRLANAIRTSNKANAIKSLEAAGLIAKVSKDSPDTGLIDINGEIYNATKVPVSDPMVVTSNGKSVVLPARYALMPTWLYREVKPILEDKGYLQDDFSLFGRVNNFFVKLMLGGPMEATSHSYRLLGGIVNSMPYMQEWAYKNGVLGQAGGLVLNNPFVKTFAGMGKILFADISSDEALNTIQEMAKIGIIPEKTWQKTWSKEFAELTGAKKVGFWDFSPILYGKNSFDLKARVTLYRLTKAMNPNATPEQVVTMQNELGNYTMALQGELEKFVKRHGLAPFYSFGGAIYRSGIKSVFGLSSLPLTRPTIKEAFTTKQGAEQMTKLATYKMAQLISAGIMGLIGYWALTYHAQTDKWPWEDKHSKLLKVPFPKWAQNEATAKMFSKKGKWEDVDFSFFNPFVNRGTRAIGAPKFYETEMLGGTFGQSVEAGSVQAINTNLSPYTSSPMIQMGTTALTGSAPYITGIRDKYSGTPGIGFYRKVNTMPAGAQMPANAAVAAVGINPLIDFGFSPLTGALKYKYGDDDFDAMSAAKSVFGTIIPHLTSPHGNDEAKSKILHKQAKAIETSRKKEAAKRK